MNLGGEWIFQTQLYNIFRRIKLISYSILCARILRYFLIEFKHMVVLNLIILEKILLLLSIFKKRSYCITLLIKSNQSITSEAINVLKKLVISSTHATKSSTNFAWWANLCVGLLPSLLMCDTSTWLLISYCYYYYSE